MRLSQKPEPEHLEVLCESERCVSAKEQGRAKHVQRRTLAEEEASALRVGVLVGHGV